MTDKKLKSFILRKKGIRPNPKTLGEHLHNRRLILGLRQEDVAEQLGTIREVYDRWERDPTKPTVSQWPSIVTFLCYYPGSHSSPAELTLMTRRTLGLEQKVFAQKLGVIHQPLRQWEHGIEWPSDERLSQLHALLEQGFCIGRPMQLHSAIFEQLLQHRIF